MDLYLTSGEPGLSLQEMIDCDIKEGIEFEDGTSSLDSVVTSHDLNELDLSGMSNLEAEMDLKTFEPLFDPLDRLEDMDIVVMGGTPNSDTSSKDHLSSGSSSSSSPKRISSDLGAEIASWMSMSSTANYNLDIENSIMVDPSVVLPSAILPKSRRNSMNQQSTFSQRYSSQESKVTTTFTTLSDNTVQRSEPVQRLETLHRQESTDSVRYYDQVPQVNVSQHHQQTSQPHNTVSSQVIVASLPTSSPASTNQSHTPHLATSASSATHTNGVTHTYLNSTNSSNLSGLHTYHPHIQNSVGSSNRVGPYTNPSRNIGTNSNRCKPKYMRGNSPPSEKTLPKPAYSYSCLIALALKNSITGSLPVSEIYSFMCEHFPYFKTAPNGWKNSVRHNLSLNKCFEKIEKPVVSGSNQRKGCLWALCPSKVHKMDEEVTKWSKKDLQGIKDAMSHPECLESLERGEMKFESFSGTSCSEDEEEDFEEGANSATLVTSNVLNGNAGSPLNGSIVNCTVVNGNSVVGTITSTGSIGSKGVHVSQVGQQRLATALHQGKPSDVISSLQPIKILNSLGGSTKIGSNQVIKQNGQQARVLAQSITVNGTQNLNSRTTSNMLAQASSQTLKKGIIQQQQHTQQQIQNSQLLRAQIRKSLIQPIQTSSVVSSSQESEYILPELPDSTMSEINIQSNGTLIDDFGNEIKLDGDMGILNSTKNSPLILRKVSTVSPNTSLNSIQNTPVQRSFVYSSQSLAHQPRLVLTNAKMS